MQSALSDLHIPFPDQLVDDCPHDVPPFGCSGRLVDLQRRIDELLERQPFGMLGDDLEDDLFQSRLASWAAGDRQFVRLLRWASSPSKLSGPTLRNQSEVCWYELLAAWTGSYLEFSLYFGWQRGKQVMKMFLRRNQEKVRTPNGGNVRSPFSHCIA